MHPFPDEEHCNEFPMSRTSTDRAPVASEAGAEAPSRVTVDLSRVTWDDLEVGELPCESPGQCAETSVVRICGVASTDFHTVELRQLCKHLRIARGKKSLKKIDCLRVLALNFQSHRRDCHNQSAETRPQSTYKGSKPPFFDGDTDSVTDDSQIDGVSFDTDDEAAAATYNIDHELNALLNKSGHLQNPQWLTASYEAHSKDEPIRKPDTESVGGPKPLSGVAKGTSATDHLAADMKAQTNLRRAKSNMATYPTRSLKKNANTDASHSSSDDSSWRKEQETGASSEDVDYDCGDEKSAKKTSAKKQGIGDGQAKSKYQAQANSPADTSGSGAAEGVRSEKKLASTTSIFEDCSEPSFSAIAGRARLVIPSTRSTDVPNRINIECRQRRPRLLFMRPPVTLMSEIRPRKRQRVSLADHLDATDKVTCYDRQTCTVLQDVCEVQDLGNLLTGYAALEPLISPPDLRSTHPSSDEIFALQGRSAPNVRLLSGIRAQNAPARCSDNHVGKNVMVTNGLYTGRCGTITSALPWGGWYKVSGLRDDESDDESNKLDLDIVVKASDVQFASGLEMEKAEEGSDSVSFLRGMDPSSLFLIR